MKTKIISLLSLQALLIGCVKNPKADFTVSNSSPIETEVVSFANESDNYKTYSWDFGDGIVTKDSNPKHIYLRPGSFKVKLKVYSKKDKKTDIKEMTINVQNSPLRNKIEGKWILDSIRHNYFDAITDTLNSSFVDYINISQKFTNPFILDQDDEEYMIWRVKSDNEIIFCDGYDWEQHQEWIIPVFFADDTHLKLIWSYIDVGVRYEYSMYYTKA